ncbi:MAG: hypothetical protein LBJ67_10665 [Planctomycetaceae bacterium]|nr:hypothetical protein [Planctomycetaceae bacterium]
MYFGLKSQMRRYVISVPFNMWSCARNTQAEFLCVLDVACPVELEH